MTKRLLVGTDEAGYGPNLGPLVVTATAWEIPSQIPIASVWDELGRVLTNSPAPDDDRLFVSDSKVVYSSIDRMEELEVPVLAFLQTLGHPVSTIDGLGSALAGEHFTAAYHEELWNPSPGVGLPLAASDDHVQEWAQALEAEADSTGVRLTGVVSRIIFPKEFNRLVDESGSKGTVLSAETLHLVRSLTDRFAAELPTLVICDKHGGRNRYDELIAAEYDDQFVFRVQESRAVSRYRMGSMEFCFRTKAEEILPVALSSMVSKYLREVLMHQFNAFWREHIPGLRPTQGYPVDAKRFRSEILETARSLSVHDSVLWRNR